MPPDAPKEAVVFEHRSVFHGFTAEQCFEFHAAPGAFGRLTPPPIFVQVHRNTVERLVAGDVEFTLWVGPVPIRWHARHMPGVNPTSFAEYQVSGPMAYWYHDHIITSVDGGVELHDRITLAHPPGGRGVLTRLMFGRLPLRFLFIYRHLRTRLGMARY